MNKINWRAKPWIQGVPVYEPGRPLDEVARELGFSDCDELAKMASNENALGPSPRAVEAMQSAAQDMHRYPDGASYHLRQALADHADLSMDHVLVGNGSNEIIELLGHVFLEEGADVVASECAFVVYKLVSALFNARCIEAPMRAFTHDLDAMLKSITDQTRILFIANPNNPTGTMVDPERLDRFMRQAPEDLLVVIDEAYIELVPPDRQPDVLRYVRDGRKVCVMRTFSKAYGLAGLRIGYAFAHPELIQLLNHARQPFNVNAMAQAAACAALTDKEHVERTRQLAGEGLEMLGSALDALDIAYVPSSANFVLAEVGRGREVFTALQREGVIVRPMDGYRLPDHIRITVGTPGENRRLVQALETVLKGREEKPSFAS